VVQAAVRNKVAVELVAARGAVTIKIEKDPRAMLLPEMVNWKQCPLLAVASCLAAKESPAEVIGDTAPNLKLISSSNQVRRWHTLEKEVEEDTEDQVASMY
jgi:hypothetical protein